jgi:hypothetical protein
MKFPLLLNGECEIFLGFLNVCLISDWSAYDFAHRQAKAKSQPPIPVKVAGNILPVASSLAPHNTNFTDAPEPSTSSKYGRNRVTENLAYYFNFKFLYTFIHFSVTQLQPENNG